MYLLNDIATNRQVEIKTEDDLGAIHTSSLVACYNELTGKSIKKFATRQKGITQTWAAIQEVSAAPAEVPRQSTSAGRQSPLNKKATIHVQVTENPKRDGSSAHARYELYREGMTIDAYLKAGGHLADIRWDTSKNFISIKEPKNES